MLEPPGEKAFVQGTIVGAEQPISGAVAIFYGPGPGYRVFRSDENGLFIAELAEGYYTVTVEALGFLPYSEDMFILNTGEQLELVFELERA